MDKMHTVQLQGIGRHYAIKAEEIVPGNVIIWNFGYKNAVLAVHPSRTGKTLVIELKGENGQTYKRKTTVDRLFAVEQ